MLEQLQTILSEATTEISKANTLDELNNLKVSLLGKKGPFNTYCCWNERSFQRGKASCRKKLNETRSEITKNLEEKINSLQEIEDSKKVLSLDVTLPGHSTTLIGRHPISQMLDDSSRLSEEWVFRLLADLKLKRNGIVLMLLIRLKITQQETNQIHFY